MSFGARVLLSLWGLILPLGSTWTLNTGLEHQLG